MSSDPRRLFFIVNKFAGGQYRPEVEGGIVDACAAHFVEPEIAFTDGPGHATELAMSASGKHNVVVAVGGDGTINEVAKGILHTETALGIIPRGSGNGLARHLCIPLNLTQAVNALLKGRVISMDAFTMNNKLSLNVSGVGFDGHVANLFGGKTKRGLAGYINLTISEYLRFPEFEVTLTIGGEQTKRKAFILAIANSSQYGNNACIAPAASVSDGLLQLNVLRKVPFYRLDFVYHLFARGIDRSEYAELHAVRDLTITSDTPLPYHVDGEPCGTASSFDISIMPAALRIVVPSTSRANL